MRIPRPSFAAASRGFTLIESVITMVVLGIAAITIVSLQGSLFTSRSNTVDLQVGGQLMQECAEQILAVRRHVGYTAVTTSTCSSLGNYGGFGASSVTLKDAAGSPVTSCPATSPTCTVAVTLSKDGTSLAPIVLELRNYSLS